MIYGYETIIDAKNARNITEDSLRCFVEQLCTLIKMERYGDTQIEYFGKSRFKGFTLVQLITTSSIVGHFTKDEIFLNVFSCKEYDKRLVVNLVKDWFKTKSVKYKTLVR